MRSWLILMRKAIYIIEIVIPSSLRTIDVIFILFIFISITKNFLYIYSKKSFTIDVHFFIP